MRAKRHPTRSDNLRRALAQEAARIMAEHGIRDFLVAKRKAAERFGVTDGVALLPKNSEIEEALVAYQRLFGGASHLEALHAQRRAALAAMRYLREIQERPVAPAADAIARLAVLSEPFPDGPSDPEQVVVRGALLGFGEDTQLHLSNLSGRNGSGHRLRS